MKNKPQDRDMCSYFPIRPDKVNCGFFPLILASKEHDPDIHVPDPLMILPENLFHYPQRLLYVLLRSRIRDPDMTPAMFPKSRTRYNDDAPGQ